MPTARVAGWRTRWRCRRGRAVGDQQTNGGAPNPPPTPSRRGGKCCTEPIAVGFGGVDREIEPRAGEERGGDGLRRFGVGDAPAGRRLVEREAEPHIAGGGDGGDAAGDRGDPAGEIVGAVMAAEQRHGHAAVFGKHDHGRLAALVVKQRRQSFE